MVLSYFYQRCFFHNLPNQDSVLTEVLSIENIFPSRKEEFDEHKKSIIAKVNEELLSSDDINFDYYVNNFFDKWDIQEIDMDYVIKVWWAYEKYLQEAIDAVNNHTQSFPFSQMNTMNQSLFLLWYIEWKVLDTPKEILLNELIELAKRYDDEWSPKLINWIMHKIVNKE